MSLEKAIIELTKQVFDLQQVIQKQIENQQGAPIKVTNVTTSAVENIIAESVTQQQVNVTIDTLNAEPDVSYDDVKAAILNLQKAKGRDAAVAVLNNYGASTLPSAKKTDWPAIIQSCIDAVE